MFGHEERVVDSPRLALAKRMAAELRRREGSNLVAAGVYGSVARGTERRYSDVDLLVVVKRKRPSLGIQMRDGILVTILQHTPSDARTEVLGSRADLNNALGGWRSLRPLYDPTRLLRTLRDRARRPAPTQFLLAARRALLETYEDLGKLRNAVSSGDLDEAREMAIWFTGGAMGALYDMEGHVLATGRRAFVEVRRRGRLGKEIRLLRYESRSLRETSRLAEEIWAGLLRRARQRGIAVGDLP